MKEAGETVALGDFLSVLTDYHANGSYKKLKENVTLLDEPTYAVMIRTTNFEKHDFSDDLKYISESAYEFLKKSKVQPGDILMNKIANPGSVYYMPDVGQPVSLAMNLFLLRTDETRLDQAFTYFWLKANEAYVKSFACGAATATITKKAVRELKLRDLPDLPTQRKIAGILSAYDDLIENNLRRIRILEEMAQSLYREWFVHFRFPGHESNPMVDSPLGPIPEGWEVKKIKDFGDVVTGKTPSKKNEEFYGAGMSFLKTPDMHGQMFILQTNENLSEQGSASQAKKTLPIGSICVSCIGTLGVVSITSEPCQTNQQINSVVLENEVSRGFLFFWLREAKQKLENLGSNGATMGNVNKSKFESMELVSPPTELLDRYHALTESPLDEIKLLLRKNQTLRQTRDLLLPRLLSSDSVE